MNDLDKVYNAEFFTEWGKGHRDYVLSVEIISSEIYRQFRPARVADIGCGCGVYGHFLSKKGVDVFSLDGVAPPVEHSFGVGIHKQDITEPFANVWGVFDMALCLEVAEHIPEELADIFLENLTRFSSVLIFSAAPPGQGGHHHVNEQPKRYWVKKLAGMGFVYSRPKTGFLSEAFRVKRPPYMWMAQQIGVYEQARGRASRPASMPFAVHIPTKKRRPGDQG
jgi:SAM-dependent methyltransferase